MSIPLIGCGSKGDLYQAQAPDSVQKTTTETSQQSTKEPNKKQP